MSSSSACFCASKSEMLFAILSDVPRHFLISDIRCLNCCDLSVIASLSADGEPPGQLCGSAGMKSHSLSPLSDESSRPLP
ncbi:hypothetical protein AMTR_s00118p00065200 [Amborella trichopoda]|uniref:Uncharacterized protein n=1 Tax=Amborella trichopoda TaxID=13333 RepID=W1NQ20_AMBTC|nr:hypothetical protein AMTR_s00118p00065200 [Amborella trichopoda]